MARPVTAVPPSVLAIWTALIEQRVGLHYGPDEQDILVEKAQTRASEAGFDTLLDYYYFLRYDDPQGQELDALIDALVVNETYFFREYEAIEMLVDHVVVPAVKAGRRPRVWSAACATGEEILTVAMLLADRDVLDRVELCATDISRRALAQARSGTFSKRSLRQVRAPHLAARFLREEESKVVVDPTLLRRVQFGRVNLTSDEQVAELGSFDAILCRNVLIYFRDEVARQLVDRLTRALVPGGHLFVGVSESLLRFGTPLDCLERHGVFVYQRAP